MATLLIVMPLVAAAVVFCFPSERWRPWLLPLASAAQLVLVVQAVRSPQPITGWDHWLVLDPLGKVFLPALTTLHLVCMLYAPGYLRLRSERPNRVLCSCLLISLGMITLVILSHHLGLMWVGVEASTLATAPGLYFNHNPRSLEATWKYLLLCSVGIALALLGSFFLAYSAVYSGLESSLLFEDLVRQAPQMSLPWLQAAFVLLFVGYGAKMGLAPMHNWKPDAYGEAPGMVGALLSGGITHAAFFAVLRIYQVCAASGNPELLNTMRQMMLTIGLVSMAVAAVFMVRQRDIKRLLAYSSVEHMGILVFGLGLGGAALYGTLLHVVNNALTKGVVFLAAGNVHRAYGSKFTADVHGAMRLLPWSGTLLLFGFLAGCGSPPFGPFVSEFTIVAAAFQTQPWLGGAFLLLLCIIFLAAGTTVLSMVMGAPPEALAKTTYPDGLRTAGPILLAMGLVLALGLYLPAELRLYLDDAVRFVAQARSP